MHPGKHAVIEALCAKGKSIHPGSPPRVDRFGNDVLRIRLDRNLGAPARQEATLHNGHRPRHPFSAKTRGRAATEIDRIHLMRRCAAESRLQLSRQRTEVFVDRHLAPYRDGEIAVGTASPAEGNVDVDVTGHASISHRAMATSVQ